MAGTSPAMTERKACYTVRMRFSLTTWNINSVRLRIDLVAKFIKQARPDVKFFAVEPETGAPATWVSH